MREPQDIKGVPMTPRPTDTSQILLLRVGMDLGFGGLGPLFPDGTFEYVPIPDDPSRVSKRSLFFQDIPARSGGSLVCVPVKECGLVVISAAVELSTQAPGRYPGS